MFIFLLCGVTAQDRQEGSAPAGAAAWKQQNEADSNAVAELIDWIVAAGGEVRPCNPAFLAYMVLLPASGRPASNCGSSRPVLQVHASVAQLPGGLRGLQASKDIVEGELVFAVPASLAVPLGDYLLHSAVCCTPHAPAGPASHSFMCCKCSALRLREHTSLLSLPGVFLQPCVS